MSYQSILVNNLENKESEFINFHSKKYLGTILTPYEISRLKFLEELFLIENLNISNMHIIESNMNFLTKNINEKQEQIYKEIYNNKIANNSKNSIKSTFSKKQKLDNNLIIEFIKINKKTDVPNDNIFLKIKYLRYFKSLSFTKKKLERLYFNKENKFFRDFTYIYFPITDLINDLYQKQTSNKPLILGIQAHQGCGKTTITSALALMLNNFYEINSINVSIDDFYKTFNELNYLKFNKPDFKYRGPPGTHDLPLAYEIFRKVKEMESDYFIPRYNKALNGGKGDRNANGFEVKFPVEVLLFEGWFLGATPKYIIKNNQINENQININENKKDENFLLLQCNENLNEYNSLWNKVDFWISLRPEHFSLSKKWRIQAEKKMKGGMDYKTIKDFCDYFWKSVPPEVYLDKLEEFEKPLIKILIDKNRNFYI